MTSGTPGEEGADSKVLGFVKRGKAPYVMGFGGTGTCPDCEKLPERTCTHLLAFAIALAAPDFLTPEPEREPGDEAPEEETPERPEERSRHVPGAGARSAGASRHAPRHHNH